MEQPISPHLLLKKCSEEIGVCLSTEQLSQFMIYLKQLQQWNQSINLTGITQDEEVIIKHFVDSLAVLRTEELKNGANLLDVGTGAGFPGIPLRIARQGLNITLVEPVQKKISFLYFIVGLLQLERVKIFYGTLDQFMIQNAPDETFDYITTRALGYRSILESGLKLLTAGGKAILYSSHPLSPLEIGGNWSLTTEHSFNLPHGFGRRVISILSAFPEQTVQCST